MRTYIIAEAGVNHNGSERLAKMLIEGAANAGADAIKFQTFSAEKLAGKNAPKAQYQQDTTGEGSQFEMLKALEFDNATFERLIVHSKQCGIEFLSTPFDIDAAKFLVEAGMKRIKVPSGELINHKFLRELATFGKPMILSTGMATSGEIHEAVAVVKGVLEDSGLTTPLAEFCTILHCTSNYPTALGDVNLLALQTIAKQTGLPVGYSDHTQGTLVSVGAVALGASIIEKHFTLDRNMEGPDHQSSLELPELTQMVDQIRDIERALGSDVKQPTQSEIEMRMLARRSIKAKRNLEAGEILDETMIDILRPADGIEPKYFDAVVGRTLLSSVAAGESLQWDNLSGPILDA
ncbi:N-acetylneuraminate synthase [Maritalea sp. S77]|uniref:N-acetylneuraminate synthase n=1 Tax=Maritalea sp. S77 TaxID=3415125 RepID=UPI003C7C9D2D